MSLTVKSILRYLFVAAALCATAAIGSAQTVDFEAYTLGNINGQNGWSKTGPFDMNVSSSLGKTGFGTKSFRISNAITSGSFGDMAFSPSNANEAGETGAANGGMSGGTRQNYFESSFSITTTTTSQQLGLLMSTAPDRGDGSRMSYLRFEDFADGIHVFFSEYKDNAPFGSSTPDAAGCGAEDDFTDEDIATLNRTSPHTIKYAIFFFDGPRNDVVQIYIDGVLVKTGTSWEDYYRYCAEQSPNNITRTVDSMLFRTSGPAHPEHNGNGFLVDNMNASTSVYTAPTMVVDDDGLASPTDCNAATPSFANIQSAVTAAVPGDTIRICSGTYPVASTINLNKANLTLVGIGARPLIQTGASTNLFFASASGVTLDNLEIAKTSVNPNQEIIAIQGNNFTAKNNLIYGPDPGTDWNTAGTVSRAFVGFAGTTGTLIDNNVIHHLRQPGYFSGGGFGIQSGVISNNNVSGTKGWVIEGGKYTFTTNTWGEPQNQSGDIALLNQPGLNPADYSDLLGISTTNDNARIDPQYLAGGAGRAISYVNSAAPANGNGSDNANYNTLASGIAGALNGGQVVATGSFSEAVTVNRNVTLKGSFTNSGTMTTTSGSTISPGNSPGIINSGNVSMVPGSNFNVELNGTTPGTGHDQLNVTGTVNLGGANLNVATGFVPIAGNTFVIINNDGTDAVSGTFNSLPQGATVFAGGYTFSISYTGGSGNDVVLTSFFACNAVSVPTNITSQKTAAVVVPVNVDDVTGNGLFSTDFRITFNPAVLQYNGVTLGNVTAGSVLTINAANAGTGVVLVSIFNSSAFAGAGQLANVNFTTLGDPGTSSAVGVTPFKFNEGTPCVTTSAGLVTVVSGTITGTIRYGNTFGALGLTNYVPSATVNAVGSVNVSSTTAPPSSSNGVYTLSGMGAGAYTMTPAKVGGVLPLAGGGQSITSNDASLIAQYVVNLVSLTAPQQAAADVSGTGGITSFDAALIARWVVSLPGSGNTASWVFTPASRNYANVNANVSGEDYSAILMGDVTGNYSQTLSPARPVSPDDEHALVTTAPTLTAHTGTVVSVPLTVGDTTGSGITSYQFLFRYDPTVLEPATDPVDLTGTISRGFIPTVNATEPGVLQVVVFGTMPLTGEGALLNLRFNTIGAVDSTSRLEWGNFSFNEGSVTAQTVDGSLRVTAATDGVINGRVLSPLGAGIRNTRVTAIDTRGNAVSTTTSSFGNFQIAGLQQGETYIVKVDSKRYRFTAQTVSLSGSAVSLDMIAQE